MEQQRAKATIKKVLNTAIQLFVKEGYHGTSIAKIAEATGLTKGAIYFHFKSKDALMAAILDQFETLYLDKMIADVESTNGDALDKMKHYLRFTVNFVPRPLHLCFTHLATELYAGGKKQKGIERIYKKYHDFVAKVLETGKKEGVFREDIDPDVLALNVIGALEGNLIQWKFNMKKHSGASYARSFIKYHLCGLQKPGHEKRD